MAQVSDLSTAGSSPVTGVPANKLVYGIQEYPTNVNGRTPDSGSTWVTLNNQAYGYLVTAGTVPVFMASGGASLDGTNGALADEQAWATSLTSYFNGTPGTSVPTTWDPANKNSNITLSNGSLTATTLDQAGLQGVKSTTSQNTGKRFFEATLGTSSSATPWGGDVAIGFANAAQCGTTVACTTDPPLDTSANNGVFIVTGFNSQAYEAGVEISPNGSAGDGNGNVISFAVDLDAKRFWYTTTAMRTAGQNWNWATAATQNPGTGLGGIPFTATGPFFAYFLAFFSDPLTLNTGATAFNQPVPANFVAWGGTVTSGGGLQFTACQQPVSTAWDQWGYQPGLNPDGTLNADTTLKSGQLAVYSLFRYTAACNPSTGTVWNPADKSTSIALSNSNKTATSTQTFANNNGSASVRGNGSKSAGKFCFEATATTLSENWNLGIANSSWNLDHLVGLGSDANGIGVEPGSAVGTGIFFNGVQVGSDATIAANGAAVTICEDFGAQLFWVTDAVMRGAGHPWNGLAGANPATGAGGISTSGLVCPCFPIFNEVQSGGVAVLNTFGPFAVAIPSTFAAWDVAPVNMNRPLLINLGANDRHKPPANDNIRLVNFRKVSP